MTRKQLEIILIGEIVIISLLLLHICSIGITKFYFMMGGTL